MKVSIKKKESEFKGTIQEITEARDHRGVRVSITHDSFVGQIKHSPSDPILSIDILSKPWQSSMHPHQFARGGEEVRLLKGKVIVPPKPFVAYVEGAWPNRFIELRYDLHEFVQPTINSCSNEECESHSTGGFATADPYGNGAICTICSTNAEAEVYHSVPMDEIEFHAVIQPPVGQRVSYEQPIPQQAAVSIERQMEGMKEEHGEENHEFPAAPTVGCLPAQTGMLFSPAPPLHPGQPIMRAPNPSASPKMKTDSPGIQLSPASAQLQAVLISSHNPFASPSPTSAQLQAVLSSHNPFAPPSPASAQLQAALLSPNPSASPSRLSMSPPMGTEQPFGGNAASFREGELTTNNEQQPFHAGEPIITSASVTTAANEAARADDASLASFAASYAAAAKEEAAAKEKEEKKHKAKEEAAAAKEKEEKQHKAKEKEEQKKKEEPDELTQLCNSLSGIPKEERLALFAYALHDECLHDSGYGAASCSADGLQCAKNALQAAYGVKREAIIHELLHIVKTRSDGQYYVCVCVCVCVCASLVCASSA